MTNNGATIYIGIDVSKYKLDVYVPTENKYFTVENSTSGINELIEHCKDINCSFVMEATGGYERLCLNTLVKLGEKASIQNAKRVRDFARAKGYLAKTDKIDSKVISEYATSIQPKMIKKSDVDESQQELMTLESRRKQLTHMLVQEKNRFEKLINQSVIESITETIRYFEGQIASITKQIENLISTHEEMQKKADIMLSVKGIGPKTTITLLALLPELGKSTHKQISSLTGLAPYNVDSGMMRGKRKIFGGRKDVRNALHMATLSAIRFNPQITKFYKHLRDAGKEKMVCITACARKLICIINAMLRDEKRWCYNLEESR